MHKRISTSKTDHPGRDLIRGLVDSFDIQGTDSFHRCLVHPPLGMSMLDLLQSNPVGRIPPIMLAVLLRRLFIALDFLHTECNIIHTGYCPFIINTANHNPIILTHYRVDIKADNIMFSIVDDSAFSDFEEHVMLEPTPRKFVDSSRAIYVSRNFSCPSACGGPILCDLGSAVTDDMDHSKDIQPFVYKAPEVILGSSWSYPVDIWNVGCMVRTRKV